MNKFLDENWADVHKELGPSIGEVFGTIFTNILNGMFETYPESVIIPDP